MKFLVAATERGFALSKPFGDSLPYDFVVDNGQRLVRVQVKSVSVRHQRVYQVKIHPRSKFRLRRRRKDARGCLWYAVGMSRGSKNKVKGYDETEIDFVAALVIPEAAWYVIPVRAVRNRPTLCVFPNNPNSKGMFEKYREAWELLR